MKGISPGRGEIRREKSRDPFCQWATLYYTSLRSGPSPGIPHLSWPPSTLDIMYCLNNLTLNIGCCGSRLISAMAQRVSEECWSRVWIRGCGIWRGLRVSFGGGGGLGAAIGEDVGRGVGVEGTCGSIGDCWKGLGIGSTLKCLWNSEAVGVWRMPKVSKVGVGRTPRCFRSGKQVIPWQSLDRNGDDTFTTFFSPWRCSIIMRCIYICL